MGGNKSSRADKGINLNIFPYDRAGKDNTIGTDFGVITDKGTHFISTRIKFCLTRSDGNIFPIESKIRKNGPCTKMCFKS